MEKKEFCKEFANELDAQMKRCNVQFKSGSLEDNVTEIVDNYLWEYHQALCEQLGPQKLAKEWFDNILTSKEEFDSLFIKK